MISRASTPPGRIAPMPLITNLGGRSATSLDGTWRFVLDPYRSGYFNIFGEPNRHGWHNDAKPRTSRDRVEYDFDSSATIEVPGDWNSQRPEYLYYEGAAWYRRTFQHDPQEGRRLFVHFGASNQLTRVWCNGKGPVEHDGGFGPFCVELTDAVEAGENSLVVMVDNSRRPDAVPTMDTDWWNYGGLHRSVTLVDVATTFVRDAWLQLDSDGSAIIGEIVLEGPESASRTVTVRVPELGVGSRLITDEFGQAAVRIAADPERWSPDNPRLYRVEWELGDEVLVDDIGFRTIGTDGHHIVLNDEPIFLKGISIHAEAPTHARRAAGRTDASGLLDWVDELGANFVRLSHYQHDEAMVRECDRRGVLAWCELPVYWGIDFENDSTYDNAEEQLEELIVRDRSRSSVILWSVANETMPAEGRQHFLEGLIDAARRLDPTRLVSAALFTMPNREHHYVLDDELANHVDVVGINAYIGWYYGDRSTFRTAVWENPLDKPAIFTEFGAGAQQGRHGTKDDIWTEEFQVDVYEGNLAMMSKLDWVAGMSPWILKDFRSPKRVLPGIQDGFNRKGLVSDRGVRKAAFETMRTFYASL
jgi:beta-glucuronidase